ncbi:MAG: sigma-70 family RNA polymerase sigma factor [Acidimicrobiia bacterium]
MTAPAGGRPGDAGGRSWDVTLAARLVTGDQNALGDAYDQYSSFVFGLARRVTADPRAAEDVTQEVFVALWERPQAYDPTRGSLRTWLATLAHRRAVDVVRREEARRRRTEREAARPTSVPNVEESALALVAAEHVRAAVEALPPDQRRAIELAYFGGKTYREVAEVLGIPEGTAKSRLRLGLRRIADTLEGMEQWV